MPFKPKVVVDYRENSDVIKYLEDFGSEVELKQLSVGDYVASSRVGIEKKTVQDFLGSIANQRIFKQIPELKESFEKPLFLIEGNPEVLNDGGVHPNSVRGVLSSIAIDHHIPVLWTANIKESAGLIHWIARREQDENRKSEIQLRTKTAVMTEGQELEYVLAGLPFVSNVLSKRLLAKFKTVRKALNSKPEKLMKVEGIGKEKANKIWEVLNREYKTE
jgi:ERCC4-type nuclease